jgi:O-methyltransferase
LTRDKEKNLVFTDRKFTYPNIDNILSQMASPEMCEIRKGYFPQTINGLEDFFSLVSLDADLFNPIYEGLKYFYPRLSYGGYIFIHDYDNFKFSGVKEAVVRFCNDNNISYFPLSDNDGSVIIMK